MAASIWTFPNSARPNLLNGSFDLDTDPFKVALFLSSSNIGLGSTSYAALTGEHPAGNGYTTGGVAVQLVLIGSSIVTIDIATDPTWLATGMGMTARFAVLYKVGGNVLAYCLLDSTPADVQVAPGTTLTLQTAPTGVFTLS